MDIEHPAARLILLASQQQDKEMGDGTNLTILLAGELLAAAEDLLRIGIRPAVIVEGYEAALEKTMLLLEDAIAPAARVAPSLGGGADGKPDSALLGVLRSVLASKHYGSEAFLASLLHDAMTIVTGPARSPASAAAFDVDSVRCVKILGASLLHSTVLPGMLIQREPMGSVHVAARAKIAVFACPISTSRTETKGTVLIKGAAELQTFSSGEEAILAEQVAAIAAAAVKVVVSGDTISELALHFIERAGMMAIKIPSKFDLRRLCKAVGATPLARLGAPTAEEAGYCVSVRVVEIGGTRCTVFDQTPLATPSPAAMDVDGAAAAEPLFLGGQGSRLATIVVRSNTMSMLDDVERAIEDGLHTIKNVTCRDGRLLAGGGAAEMEIARLLAEWAKVTPGLTQHAIKAYGGAFEAIPATIASNAGGDAAEVINKLHWAHNKGLLAEGVDVDSAGDVVDAPTLGIFDALIVKKNAIRLATEAALTVLRVDQIIMSKPAGAGAPKPRPAGPIDEDD